MRGLQRLLPVHELAIPMLARVGESVGLGHYGEGFASSSRPRTTVVTVAERSAYENGHQSAHRHPFRDSETVVNTDDWRQLAATFANDSSDAVARRLCEASIDAVGVDGAGITLMDGDQTGPLCICGHGAAELEELQFTLGEGPCHDAFRLGAPVQVPSFDSDAPTRWLPFAELATRTGVGAVDAYPLISDNVRLGVLTLYRLRPGHLDADQQSTAAALADVVAEAVMAMHDAAPVGELPTGFDNAFSFRAVVHQASGMVAAQLDIPAETALVRIRAHAYASGQTISRVAADILARRLHLDDDRTEHEGVGQ